MKSGGSSSENSQCIKCGKNNVGKCLMRTYKCFGCGNNEHMMKHCPMDNTQGRESIKAQSSGLTSNALKKSRFYALKFRGDQEDSPNIVTVLHVLSIYIYALLDPSATLYFVTTLVDIMFDVLLDVLA